MELTRKQVIEILQKHHMWTGEPQEVVDVRLENAALDYAISSLKTDEAYQIMYEGGEIFTKDDMVAILTELQLEISELWDNNADYIEGVHDSEMIIQQKINAIKG